MSIKLNGSNSGSVELDVLADAGLNTAITFPAASGTVDRLERAGNILQVVSTTKTDTSTFTSLNATYTSEVPGLTVDITPSSTSNKILIRGVVCFSTSGLAQNGVAVTLLRDGTEISIANAGNSNTRTSFAGFSSPDDNRLPQAIPFEFLDSPNSTSQITYGLKLFQPFAATISVYVNLNGDGSAGATRARTASVITAMEVAV